MPSSEQDPQEPPRKRVGVSDIAKRAGVAIGTVSNYLNYPDRVSDTLKDKIRKAIDELGYIPRRARVQQASMHAGLVGYVMTDIEHSLFTDIFEGIQEVCDDNGMQVIGVNASSDARRQAEFVRMFIRLGCSGIVLSTVFDSPDEVEEARAAGVGIVLVDHANPPSCAPASSILEDNRAVGHMAAEELMRTGCRRLAFVAHSFDYQSVQERYDGAYQAVEAHDGPVSLELIDSHGLLVEDGYGIGRALLQRLHDGEDIPDGIIAASDYLGIGIIRALVDDGSLQVPNDVSVIGCEGARITHPSPIPMTTIDAPGNDMGRRAMAELLDARENPGSYVRSVTLMEPTLHRRASTRSPEGTPSDRQTV